MSDSTGHKALEGKKDSGHKTVNLNLGNAINQATEKKPIIGADEIGYWDSVTGTFRKIAWSSFHRGVAVFVSATDPTLTEDVEKNDIWFQI